MLPHTEDRVTRPPVDLGQLRLTVHDLLGHYREGAPRLDRETSDRNLDMQVRIVERDLAALDLEHAYFLAYARGLLHERDRLRRLQGKPVVAPSPGLLEQLARPIPSRGGDDAGKVTTSKTGSRAPGSTAHVDLLKKIRDGVRKHHFRLVREVQAAEPDLLPPTTATTWQEQLWALPALATALGPEDALVTALDRDLQSWRGSARVLLGYVAPMTTLTLPCPHCGQQSMLVREDATSDVVCVTDGCVDPETNRQSRWPRNTWRDLLAGRYAQGLVNTEAACLHLKLDNAATLRDWKRRGLIEPAGGTARKPYWRVSDLDAAAEQVMREMQVREEKRARKAALAEKHAALTPNTQETSCTSTT